MLRFQSAIQVDNLPDEALDSTFEVIMPTLTIGDITTTSEGTSFWGSLLSALGGDRYTPVVESITFGLRNFGTDTRRVRTGWCNVPNDIQNYSDVKITMFCSNGMLTQYYLEAWKNLIFNADGEYYNRMNVYKKNIEVYFFGPTNITSASKAVAHYTLVGCFPTTQNAYNLKYSMSPQRLTLTQTFKMDKIIFDQEIMKSSIKGELMSDPLGVLDKMVADTTDGVSQYSLGNTY